jgi:hypothetical protein
MRIAQQYRVARSSAQNVLQTAYHASAAKEKQVAVIKPVTNKQQPKQPKKSEEVKAVANITAKDDKITGDKNEGRRCWNCNETGHLRTQCKKPLKAAYVNEVEDVECEEVEYEETSQEYEDFIYVLTSTQDTIKPDQVILDNGASTSIFCNRNLLTDIRRVNHSITFRGLSGTITANEQGVYQHYGLVWVTDLASANLLSWSELLTKGKLITYESQQDYFRVGDDVFTRTTNGLYALSETSAGLLVTRDYHSKKDIGLAKLALQIWENVGPVGPNKIKYLLKHNKDGIQPKHVDLAVSIFGAPKALDLGRATLPVPLPDVGNPVFVHGHQEITLFSDVMETMSHLFLVARAKPIGLALSTYLGIGKGARLAGRLLKAFQIQVAVLASHNFIVKRVVMDGEAGLRASFDEIRKMRIQVTCVTTTHVPEAEALIRELKYYARGCFNVLPYILPHAWVPDLVSCACQRINLLVTDSGLSGVPPIEALTGIPVDYKIEAAVKFGTYAMASSRDCIGRNRIELPRAEEVIVIGMHNRNGALKVRMLASGLSAVRSKVVAKEITQDVIERINARSLIPVPVVDVAPPQVHNPQVVENVARDLPHLVDPDVAAVGDDDPEEMREDAEDLEGIEIVDEEVQNDLILQGRMVPDFNNIEEHLADRPRRAVRVDYKRLNATGHVVHKLGYVVNVVKLREKHGDKVDEAIKEELTQIVNLKVFQMIHRRDIPAEHQKSILRSFLLLSEKHTAAGDFDRVKGRLVANGAQQVDVMWEDTSSPTASTSTLFMVCAIAAKRAYNVATADVKNAYLHARLPESTRIYMKLSDKVTHVLVSNWPEYKTFLDSNNGMYVRLRGALYGCKEAALMWYLTISKELMGLGFQVCSVDKCLFIDLANEVFVVLYVDDLFVSAKNNSDINRVFTALENKFGRMKQKLGNQQEYLGMVLIFNEHKCKLDMTAYVRDVVEDWIYLVKRHISLPAGQDLFLCTEGAISLDDKQAKVFHSVVAKLLYLAKRGRPDLMLAVAFLATRVTCATNEDFNKLSKLIKYMEATKERVLFIGANDHSILYCYVDASFGVHKDTKSHTGIFMSLGYGPVYTQSKKQSIIARSSFEAEIIAVSDALSIALWHNQVLISLGESSKIVLLQDNQGVLDVLRSGIINGTHSKHIAVRFNWLLELISSVNIKVKWIPTENMIADTLLLRCAVKYIRD